MRALTDTRTGVSGGTLEVSPPCPPALPAACPLPTDIPPPQTTFSLFEHCTLRKLIASTDPYALSPIQGPAVASAPRIRRHPELGILTAWVQAIPDVAIVMRSWGLRDAGAYYGPRFTFREYRRTRSWLSAVVWVVLIAAVSVLPLIPPLRCVFLPSFYTHD